MSNKLMGMLLSISVVIIIAMANINASVKEERTVAVDNYQELADEMEAQEEAEEEEEIDGYSIHTDSRDTVASFIEGYFDYDQAPNQRDVAPFATEQALRSLSFEEDSEDYDHITSEVNGLAVYYGSHTETSQEVFVTFDNVITYEEIPSTVRSYVELTLIDEGNEWKVDEIAFNQGS